MKNNRQKKMGRPPKSASAKQSRAVKLNFTGAEMDKLLAYARRDGRPLATILRSQALSLVGKEA